MVDEGRGPTKVVKQFLSAVGTMGGGNWLVQWIREKN